MEGGSVLAFLFAFALKPLGLRVVPARARLEPPMLPVPPDEPEPTPEPPKFDIASLRLPDDDDEDYSVDAAKPRERVPHVRYELQIVSAEKGVDLLIQFVNRQAKSGYYTATEIDEAWNLTCIMNDLEPLPPHLIREALDARHLKVGRARLNLPQFLEVRRRNAGLQRPVLYRIPAVRTAAGRSGQTTDVSGSDPGKSGLSPDHVRTKSKMASTPGPDAVHLEAAA